MEQQKQILDFQIPFELGSRNSNRVSAVPSLIQGAEHKQLHKCLNCNKQFEGWIIDKRKYCSHSCSNTVQGKNKNNLSNYTSNIRNKSYKERYGSRAEEIKKKLSESNIKHCQQRWESYKDIIMPLWNDKKTATQISRLINKSRTFVRNCLIFYKIDVSRDKKFLFRTGYIMSKETRQKLSKAVTGEKNGMYGKPSPRRGKKHTKETIELLRKARLKQIFPLKDTSIERKVKLFLDRLNIKYNQHKVINIEHCYQCDFYIPETNTVIECDGDYWHNYPIGREIDHSRTREMVAKGINVIRLWERQIKVMNLDSFNRVYDRQEELK